MGLSVLISLFEKERPGFLYDSLKSLTRQTRVADEVVVVWDGPLPADLVSVMDEFRGDLNIRDVRLSTNQGLGAALNAGLLQCRYDLVARLDADDVALPDRFALQMIAFEQDQTLDLLGGYAVEIDQDGTRGHTRTVPATHDEIISSLWANPMIHPAVMFKRERILGVGSYDPSLRRRQDYDLWFRCAAAGLKFGNIAKPLIEYRFSEATHKRQSRSGVWQQGVIGFRGSRNIGLPLWKQLACFVPFTRSLLPSGLQHRAYRFMQKFDPRRSKKHH